MTFILALFRSKLARQVGYVLAIILAVVTFGKVQKHKGRVEERRKEKEADNENALKIDDRVDAANKLHDAGKHEYRDS